MDKNTIKFLADGLVCSCESEKRDLIQIDEKIVSKIYCVGGGVDLERFRPLNKIESSKKLQISSNRVIFFAGRIEPFKGIDSGISPLSFLA